MGFDIDSVLSKIDSKTDELVDDAKDKIDQVKSKLSELEEKYNSWSDLCDRNDEKIKELGRLKRLITEYEAFIIKRKKSLEDMTGIDTAFSSKWGNAQWSGTRRDMFDSFLEAHKTGYMYYEETLNKMIDELQDKICDLECEKNDAFGFMGDIANKCNEVKNEIEKEVNDWDWVALL